jgi:hypothetical protein
MVKNKIPTTLEEHKSVRTELCGCRTPASAAKALWLGINNVLSLPYISWFGKVVTPFHLYENLLK